MASAGLCYGCGASFGLFKKEHGCKNCGFAFCTKCLTKTARIPKLDNTKHSVCNKCYDIITGKVDSPDKKERYSPPAAYLKRVAALEDRESGKSKSNSHSAPKPVPVELRGLSKADREIAQRLNKLKEKPKNAPKPATDKDLSERLDRLKGVTPQQPVAQTSQGSKTQYYHPPDRRSEQQQVDELLNEIADEVELDERFDPVACVEKRLAQYKDQEGTNKGANSGANDLSNNLNKSSTDVQKPYDKNIAASSSENEVSLEEIKSLILAAAQELEVDARKAIEGLQKDKELMERLNEIKKRRKLSTRGADPLVNSNVDDGEENEESEDEEQATKRILKHYLDEAKLNDAVGGDDDVADDKKHEKKNSKVSNIPEKSKPNRENENLDYEDPDELPYCTLCTEDATIRCIGCNYDIYCNQCFRQCHEEFNINDHVSIKYIPPKQTT